MASQVTITNQVSVHGVNIYNGRENTVTFHGAQENTGLVFIVKNTKIPANLEYAEHKRKAIMLDNGIQRVHLVEHLLSAVYALGIDNLEIELSDNVCPTTNNCSQEYFDALRNVRIQQDSQKIYWTYSAKEQTSVRTDEQRKPDCLHVHSQQGFVIDYFAYYPHKVIGEQRYSFNFNEEHYAQEIASARPPGFIKNGLFKKAFFLCEKLGVHGLNNQNYLWITSKNAKNYANSPEFGPRYEGTDFVRHKLLDVLGTLALTGRQFENTHFNFNMTGHKFDLYALKKLFSTGCFTEVGNYK